MGARHTITELLRKEDGRLAEAEGLPSIRAGEVLPPDLRAFYACCGGLVLQRARIQIVAPERFVPAGEALVGWYVLAETTEPAAAARIAIDLGPAGSGRCCDVAVDGDGAPIVATSFTSFVSRLGREGVFWGKGFVPLGDAREG